MVIVSVLGKFVFIDQLKEIENKNTSTTDRRFHTFGEAVSIMNIELYIELYILFPISLILYIRLDDVSLKLLEPQLVHL